MGPRDESRRYIWDEQGYQDPPIPETSLVSVLLLVTHTCMKEDSTSLFQSFSGILDNHSLSPNEALQTSHLHLTLTPLSEMPLLPIPTQPKLPTPGPSAPSWKRAFALFSQSPLCPDPSRVGLSACSLRKVISCYPDTRPPNKFLLLLGGHLAFSTF